MKNSTKGGLIGGAAGAAVGAGIGAIAGDKQGAGRRTRCIFQYCYLLGRHVACMRSGSIRTRDSSR